MLISLSGENVGYVTVSAKIPRKLKELMDRSWN
jgi:hypothetical protein